VDGIYFSHAVRNVRLWLLNIRGKVKVKCTLVQALRLCTGCTAHRGSRGITLPFHDHGIGSGWGVSVTPRPLFTPGKGLVTIVQKAGWAPGPVWTGAENLAPTRFDPRTVQFVASRIFGGWILNSTGYLAYKNCASISNVWSFSRCSTPGYVMLLLTVPNTMYLYFVFGTALCFAMR
jgi:hypothetical protein